MSLLALRDVVKELDGVRAVELGPLARRRRVQGRPWGPEPGREALS